MTAPTATETRVRTPRIEQGTRLAETDADAEAFADAVARTSVDPSTWTGAFATNVWAGRFEIDRILGAGGQGTTFAGTDRKTGARVAVKLFDLRGATDWKEHELFEREVRVLRNLSHPHIPSFIDVIEDEESGTRALVMSQVIGEDLGQLLETDGPMSEADLWRLLVDVGGVLNVLHERDPPLLHRDIKPRNLVRGGSGLVSVVDFGGIGRARGEAGSTVVGTFGYMAPEQLYGKSSPATDIYALGATVLTLATGKEPEDQPRKGLAIDVTAAAPHLSAPMRQLLEKMLSPEPALRPQDASALDKELRRLASQQTDADRTAAGSASDGAPVTDARFRTKDPDLDDAMGVLSGIIAIAAGSVGTALAIAFGEVLIPVLLMVISGFTDKTTKARLDAWAKDVRKAGGVARKSFGESVEFGVRTLQGVDNRKKRRALQAKENKRTRRQQARAERKQRREAQRAPHYQRKGRHR